MLNTYTDELVSKIPEKEVHVRQGEELPVQYHAGAFEENDFLMFITAGYEQMRLNGQDYLYFTDLLSKQMAAHMEQAFFQACSESFLPVSRQAVSDVIFPDPDRMFHKMSVLCGNRTGGQILKKKIQRPGTLPVGLLADGGGDNALSQHLQCGGNFVERDDLWAKSGFLYGPAASMDSCSGEEQGIQVRMAFQELPGKCVALKFIIVVFQNFRNPNTRIRSLQRIFKSCNPFCVAQDVGRAGDDPQLYFP